MYRRLPRIVLVAIPALAVPSARPAAQPCPEPPSTPVGALPGVTVDAATPTAAITVRVAVPGAPVQARLAALLAACGLAPTASSPGALTAELPQQAGWLGTYALTVHVGVGPDGLAPDAPTVVRFAATETLAPGTVGAIVTPVGPKSRGRAGAVWQTFRALAAQLVQDATAAAPDPRPGP